MQIHQVNDSVTEVQLSTIKNIICTQMNWQKVFRLNALQLMHFCQSVESRVR